ncbi:head GIN domain-containing protein [Costertonia aggregata]|uniref:DUF2807 domain-containing protein n=1 Tax=Costertonia aggregata TaxID=343403 RepID=A0A7H9AL79_9FLAO|nr:head GIN domain-containing protein [Costertonia aggregata]QLG44035.1 DUF2807 domain-containing protein [Costertonia aggregata]
MTTLARIAIGLIIAVFLSSCAFDINFGNGKKGNGVVVNETREITDEFTIITASEGLQVYVTQAKDFNIEVEADENIIDLIGTDIRDGRLKVHAIENIGNATKKVYVSLPDITAIKASSGAQLTSENTIKSNNLEVDGSSGAILNAEFIASEVDIEASSGANLSVSGTADKAEVDVSSGGNINAKELEVKTCRADASSGGNIKIHVSKSLTADASSGGSISYLGEPNVETKKSVSGSVHKY